MTASANRTPTSRTSKNHGSMPPSAPTMILRNIAVRHGGTSIPCSRKYQLTDHTGRTAFPRPFSRALRSLSTNSNPVQHTPPEVEMDEEERHQIRFPKIFIQHLERRKSEEFVAKYKIPGDIKQRTGHLGSVVESIYDPGSVLKDPPRPEDVTLELLMASQAHMGHNTSLWHPANQRYIYGIRQGIHIISLEQTAAHLRRAAKVVEGIAYSGGLILFIGTRAGQDRCVIRAAKLAKGCHLFQRWIPGSITNNNQILGKCKTLVVDENDEEIPEFHNHWLEVPALKPDLVVCLNPLENYVCLHECRLHNIPTIGIIDTDTNPSWVTYAIPANDDRYVHTSQGV